MSEPTIIDAEDIETETTEITLEDKVEELEGLVKGLLEGHKNILEHFQEMVRAVTEVANATVTEEEIFENIIDLSLVSSEE